MLFKNNYLVIILVLAGFLAGCTASEGGSLSSKIKNPLGKESGQQKETNVVINRDEEYKQIAIDYLAGQPVLAAASIGILPASEVIKAKPTSYKLETLIMQYDPVKDEYLLPLMAPSAEIQNRVENREIKIVTLEYDEAPYSVQVQIDILNNKVAGWLSGRQ